MKASLISLLVVVTVFLTGCETPVAIDPQTGKQQTAKYQAGFFYAPLDAPIGEVFQVAIRELDEMGYFRTGELHRDESITIYARKVGDERVTLRSYIPSPNEEGPQAQSMLRIRIGKFGDLPESQAIYARIRDAL
jgi:hypothetical protein